MAEPAGAPHVTLRRLDIGEALDRAGRLAEIYCLALGAEAEPADRWASNLRTCLETYAGATVLAATSPEPDGEILGFLFGFDLQLQHWWPREIRDAVESHGHGAWLEDAFELMDLQVDPCAQGQGIGTGLLQRQFSDMPHRRMLLSAEPDGRSRLLYRRLGFVDLVPDFVYAGTTCAAALMGWDRQMSAATSSSA